MYCSVGENTTMQGCGQHEIAACAFAYQTNIFCSVFFNKHFISFQAVFRTKRKSVFRRKTVIYTINVVTELLCRISRKSPSCRRRSAYKTASVNIH